MKRRVTLLLSLFLVLGLQAQEYVMRVYQGGNADTYTVAEVDSMFFFNDGYSFSYEWPIDNFTAKVVSFSADEMRAACTVAGTDWETMKSGFANGTFKMFERKKSGDVDYTKAATGSEGFYFNASGEVCQEGATECAFKVNVNTEGSTLAFDVALYPYENLGDSPLNPSNVITGKFCIGDVAKTASFPIAISITILDAGTAIWAPTYEETSPLTYDCKMPVTNAYKSLPIQLNTTAIVEALGLESADALVSAVEDGDVELRGINVDGSVYQHEDGRKHTTNNFGQWFDAEGNACAWGDGAKIACESFSTTGTDVLKISMTQYPNSCTVGDTYTVKQAYMLVSDSTKALITYNITIVE